MRPKARFAAPVRIGRDWVGQALAGPAQRARRYRDVTIEAHVEVSSAGAPLFGPRDRRVRDVSTFAPTHCKSLRPAMAQRVSLARAADCC